MKYIKLFENYNLLESLKLEDVIGSIEDYLYKTYTASDSDDYSPYGCESKYYLNQLIEDSDALSFYDIDLYEDFYWKSSDFVSMMKDGRYDFSLPNKFNKIKKELINISDNKINIYRCISVGDDYIKNFLDGNISNLGKYWSYTLDDIGAPDAKNYEKLIVFCGIVDSINIDWKQTILFNLNYHVGETEKEIILNKDSKIFLDEVLYSDEISNKITDLKRFPKRYTNLDITHLQNKTFTI